MNVLIQFIYITAKYLMSVWLIQTAIIHLESCICFLIHKQTTKNNKTISFIHRKGKEKTNSLKHEQSLSHTFAQAFELEPLPQCDEESGKKRTDNRNAREKWNRLKTCWIEFLQINHLFLFWLQCSCFCSLSLSNTINWKTTKMTE